MSVKNESALYETLLSLPSMGDPVKMVITVPRKLVLLIAQLIESGASAGVVIPPALLQAFKKEELDILKSLPKDMLEKAGIADFHEKMKALL